MPKNIPHLHPLNAQLIHIDRDQIRSVSHSIQKKEYCIWKWSLPMFFSLSIWCLADVNWSVWMKYASYFVNGFVFLFYFFLLTDFVAFFCCCFVLWFSWVLLSFLFWLWPYSRLYAQSEIYSFQRWYWLFVALTKGFICDFGVSAEFRVFYDLLPKRCELSKRMLR